MATPPDHPEREKLVRFLAGQLRPGEGAREVVRHLLSGCEECASLARQRLGFEPLAGNASGPSEPGRQTSRENPGAAEEATAPELLQQLRGHPHPRQLTILRNHPRFQTAALVDELCKASHELRGSDPSEAARLASLAVTAADGLPPGRYPDPRLRSLRFRARIYLGNSLRISGSLRASRQAFEEARGLLDDEDNDRGEDAFLDYHLGMLHNDEGRFEEALAALGRAVHHYRSVDDLHSAGKALVRAALVYLENSRPQDAMRLLGQAAPLVSPEREPRLVLSLFHNLALAHCDAGLLDSALSLLADSTHLYEIVGTPADCARRLWLEATVLSRKQRLGEAVARFGRAREGFLKIGLPLEAALVSLELAGAYAEKRWTTQVRRLIGETVTICEARGLHREALAALAFLRSYAAKQRPTKSAILQVYGFLKALQRNPGLRWEPGHPGFIELR